MRTAVAERSGDTALEFVHRSGVRKPRGASLPAAVQNGVRWFKAPTHFQVLEVALSPSGDEGDVAMPARSEGWLLMTGDLLYNEPGIRLVCTLGVFTLMAVLEGRHPRRKRSFPRRQRWPNNLGVTLLDALLARIVLPTSAIGLAVIAESYRLGFFNRADLPAWLEIVGAIILLDLAIYGQHVLFHYVPMLWRFHRMHHADLDLDVTTGTRFHPVEILLSFGIKFVVVGAVGASPLSVLIFEVLLNATSLFNHSNLRLPRGLEWLLRCFVVTPDMHRVHHSILSRETNSNFGFNLPWWDRLFRTYRAQPEAGHDGMTLGLDRFRDPEELRLGRMLTQPFRDDGSNSSEGNERPIQPRGQV